MRFFWRGGKEERLTDREIEQLLDGVPTGRDDLADLEVFLATLASDVVPPRDPGQMATALAATARSTTTPKGGLRRVAAVAASVAVLLALSGVAMAADGASPGDPLYGVDQALELVGINDGGVEERIAEFEAMLEKGETEAAIEFLDDYIQSASGPEIEQALDQLETTTGASNQTEAGAQGKVGDLREYLEENAGDDVGDDGRDFGQDVSDLAGKDKGRNQEPADPETAPVSPDQATSHDNETGPPQDPGGSENAGKSEEAGQPDNPGSPEEPGGNQNENGQRGNNPGKGGD